MRSWGGFAQLFLTRPPVILGEEARGACGERVAQLLVRAEEMGEGEAAPSPDNFICPRFPQL